MNSEQEVGRSGSGQASLSPKEDLNRAIERYFESVVQEDSEDGGGLLVAWYVVVEKQDIVAGTSRFARAVKDLQGMSSTLGLISYSDKAYTAIVSAD